MPKSVKKPRSRFARIFRWSLLSLLLLSTIVVTIFIWSVNSNLPPLNDIENPRLDLSSRIYTADGEVMGTFHDRENRIYIPLDSMSTWIKAALIATEDVRFYSHSGIDPRTPIVIIKDLITKRRLRGGSGISQQLARNLYDQVGRDRTALRKVKEAIVAVKLEARFTKDEIMQAYLNTTTFYGNTYGIEMGAQTLFGKSAADVDLHEAALLVGLLKGPSQYSPTRSEKAATARRNVVLSQVDKYMVELNERFPELRITNRRIQAAKESDLGLNLNAGSSTRALAPYFRDQVKEDVTKIMQEEGLDEKYNLYTDGLKIFTTVDGRMQRHAERAVKEHLSGLQTTFNSELKKYGEPWKSKPEILRKRMEQTDRWRRAEAAGMSDRKILDSFEEAQSMRIWTYDGEVDTTISPKDSLIHYMRYLQTGMMSMDPHTGEIKAWVGGVNYKYFKLDHVAHTRRQVGSTFKPIVYAAGMKESHRPCDRVLDVPVAIELPSGQVWRPENSGGKDDGLISYYEGLARSKNQVTAILMNELGAERVCDYARAFGITSDLECVPSLALGTSDITVSEMTGVYSTFVNDGNYTKPFLVRRIEDKTGRILYQHTPEVREVLDPVTAFDMVRMLQGVVEHNQGTGHRLRSKYKFTNQMGGKTGTTQNNTDGWFMGITPNLVTGVWVGNDDPRLRFKRTLYGQGANMALPIFAIYMKHVYADKSIGLKPDPFQAPEGYQMEPFCPVEKKATMWEDTETPPEDYLDRFGE